VRENGEETKFCLYSIKSILVRAELLNDNTMTKEEWIWKYVCEYDCVCVCVWLCVCVCVWLCVCVCARYISAAVCYINIAFAAAVSQSFFFFLKFDIFLFWNRFKILIYKSKACPEMKFDCCLEILCKFFEHHFAFFLKQSGLIDSVTKVSNSKMTLINLLSLKKCTFGAFWVWKEKFSWQL